MGVLQGFATKPQRYTTKRRLDDNVGGGGDEMDPATASSQPVVAHSAAQFAPPQQSALMAVESAAGAAAAAAAATAAAPAKEDSRTFAAAKHLFCGGVAGAAAKTITAPFSRLTILYQVHSMVTTKAQRPKFAVSFWGGFEKIVERGGILSLWKGNGTSVLHRFPFSAINFYVYENVLDVITGAGREVEDEDGHPAADKSPTSKLARFAAGATSGSVACMACYPLDLVRTRLTTEFEGREHYRGISDAFGKIYRSEGVAGFYSGIGPTLMVAVPNFAISLTVYGSLKEYVLDDELFYNLRKVDSESGEETMGLYLTLMCGAASGCLSTLVTFPFDTVRRRMQIQGLHMDPEDRLSGKQHIQRILGNEGVRGIYRGLTPELIKVLPMVGTMFLVYEYMKDQLNVKSKR